MCNYVAYNRFINVVFYIYFRIVLNVLINDCSSSQLIYIIQM